MIGGTCRGVGFGIAFALCVLGAGTAWAQIQTGPFAPGSPWYMGPAGSTGVLVLPGNQTIERVSDGAVFDLPLEVQPSATHVLTFRLSPSQQVLYVERSNQSGSQSDVCGGFPNVQVHLYGMDNPPSLTAFSITGGAACMTGGVDQGPYFYDQAGTIRTMVAVGAGSGNTPQFLWADLILRQYAIDGFTYSKDVDRIHFAPSGNAAFVVHGLPTAQPGGLYTIVDLCADPLGGSVSGVQPLPEGGSVTAEVVGSAPSFLAEVLVNGAPTVPATTIALSIACFAETGGCCHDGTCYMDSTPEACTSAGGSPIPDSTCSPDPCTTPCCLPDGSCALFGFAACLDAAGTFPPGDTCDAAACPQPTVACCTVDPFTGQGSCYDLTEAECQAQSGVSEGPGTRCYDDQWQPIVTCPSLHVSVVKRGPAEVRQGELLEYTLDYVNDGDFLAPAVVVQDNLPSYGAQFVSADGGGVYDPSTHTVQWTVGDLAIGAGGQLRVTARQDCSWSGFPLSNSARANSGPIGFSLSVVDTSVLGELTDPVGVSIQSVPASGPPVVDGERITHTIRLVNTLAETRRAINFVIGVRAGMTLESVVADGGGQIGMPSAQSWSWTGDLAAQATVDVIVTSLVDPCVQVAETGLKDVWVYSFCGSELGSATAPSVAVRRRLEVAALATSLAAPATLETFTSKQTLQLLRQGDVVDFRLSLTNPFPMSAAGVSARVVVPSGFDPVGEPPFIAPTDPGATWNAAARRIDWAGTLAAQQTLTISFRAVQVAAVTASSLSSQASNGTCTFFSSMGLGILPSLPPAPYLIGLQDGRLFTFDPAVDTQERLLFQFTEEYVTGMGRGSGGDLWIVGLPTFRLNPDTVEIEGFPVTFADELGIAATDAAVDPTDGSVIFVGSMSVGSGSFAAIRRYDPSTGTVGAVYDEPQGPFPTIRGFREVVVEPGGAIGLVSDQTKLYRFDPIGGTMTDISDPGTIANYGALGLDEDGSYVVSKSSSIGQIPLVDVDPASGVHDMISPDLKGLLPAASWPPRALAGGDAGDVYFAGSFSGLGVVHRQPSVTGEELIPGAVYRPTEQLAYVSAACADLDGDGYGVGPGCGGTAHDCDDADASVNPGATEINDGRDNQCPGDTGHGLVDELPGPVSVTLASAAEICWPAMVGATGYEIARLENADPSASCTLFSTASTCWTETASPAPGQVWGYLVRAATPFPGSWGADSNGVERVIGCP